MCLAKKLKKTWAGGSEESELSVPENFGFFAALGDDGDKFSIMIQRA